MGLLQTIQCHISPDSYFERVQCYFFTGKGIVIIDNLSLEATNTHVTSTWISLKRYHNSAGQPCSITLNKTYWYNDVNVQIPNYEWETLGYVITVAKIMILLGTEFILCGLSVPRHFLVTFQMALLGSMSRYVNIRVSG